ncbi:MULTISPECIES: M23 family metallopeptidase [Brevibacillus]|uniref:M23 family metallopeptidase n=1 Tax=Brevibacillus TaxID=55080 RepID=UPI00024052AF|nr:MULTISPECIES: M23 family metallopeptidase [Brevibacillus]MBA4531197.1 M23 family metallopeptidase [Brevibacillus halotolerans]MCR8962103.1 M23 family metallopeptidase [Brevibacillus laterosporus]MCZ0834258.1 M23 family metallopeptidase [Brevibacillus halotolerans]CCF16927.1 peptidase M23 family protein [Brevibacillus laterosporus GI-9]
MFHERERVKERRQERKEQLLLQSRDSMPPHIDELHDPIKRVLIPDQYVKNTDFSNETPPSKPVGFQLKRQIYLSLAVIGVAYVLLKSPFGVPNTWRDLSREVMTRDFNFEGVAVWYEQVTGHSSSALPVLFNKKEKESVPANAYQLSKWSLPKEWKIAKEYDTKSAKIVVDLGDKGEVVNMDTGWVTFVGEKPGYGTTVVMQYTNDREIWYGNLEKVNVSVNDWVNKKDTVGVAKPFVDQVVNTRYLFMAMKQNGRFTNPLDVISFE